MTIATDIISINENLFGANIKIILDTPSATAPPAPATTAPMQPGRPSANLPTMRTREIPAAAAQQTQQNQQAINENTYFDDEEYRLNIEDIDMEIKLWGQLIASIINFLKSTLLNENIFQIVKTNFRRKN